MASETMTLQEAIAVVSDMLTNHLRTPDDIAIETLLAHARAALAPQGVTDDDLGYGNCPVQIEGRTRDDRDWYFRARGEHFSLCLGPVGDHTEFSAVNGEPILEGKIHSAFAAGWMPHALAKALCDWAISCYERDTGAALRAAGVGA